MLFNSIHFIVFLPVVFCLYWVLSHRWRWMLLLFASYYFYLSWSPWAGILLLGTTLIDYYAALQISRTDSKRKKKLMLWASIVANIGVLVAFKYSVFFYNTAAEVSHAIFETGYTSLEKWLVPAGLSFYTFQSLSYTIDVYRGHTKAEPSAARFALYVSFFPQLVAGPIERFSNLMPQFYEKHVLTPAHLVTGMRLVTWGYFKKLVIADRLGAFVNPVFDNPADYSGLTLLIIGFFFTLQIYCDFSGYTDIARGVAKLLGYELMINFRRPLLAVSVRDFWKRWHISMTSWFRDYLYIPMGGNRVAVPRWLFNIFIVFLVSGLWHGANFTFIIWGALHGAAYIIEALLARWKIQLPRFLGFTFTLLFVSLAFIAFRASSVETLGVFYSRIFSQGYDPGIAFNELRNLHDLFPLLLSVAGIAFLFLKEIAEELSWFGKSGISERMLRPVFYVVVFVMLFVLGEFSANEFIYFNF